MPDDQPEETTELTAVDNQERRDGNIAKLISNPTDIVGGKQGAFGYEAFGDPDQDETPVGGTKKFTTTEHVTGGRWVKLEFTAEKIALPDGHFAKVASGQQTAWRTGDYGSGLTIRVVDSSTGWDSLSRFTIRRGTDSTASPTSGTPDYQSSNPFSANGLKMSGFELEVTAVQTTGVVLGRSQGYFEEIFGAATSYGIGTQRTYELSKTASNGKKIKLLLRSEVKSGSGHWSGRSQLWTHPVISVVEDETVTDKTWVIGDTFEDKKTVSASNIFAAQYRSLNKQIGIRFSIEAIKSIIITGESLSGDRGFAFQTQYADISFYGDLVQRSNGNEPEHNLVYVNEMVENDPVPDYEKLTTAGLVLRASNTFSRLDQLRVWLGRGVQVRRLHPDLSAYNDSINTTSEGPSNLFTDLVFYLLTNYTAGAGSLLNMSANSPNLVNVSDLEATSRFLRANKIFCNGAITEKVNIREFIASNAPKFLCNFVLSNGKFSLLPALPTQVNGEISTDPIQVKQIFTSGNILEDTFEL